ncbi:insulinase family protein [Massilia sp. H-1]|nr:insulinase family protein [Massilia sp. H-1]
MTKSPLSLLAVLGCLVLSLGACACAALAVPTLPIEKYTLPNGLEVILVEDHKLPLVTVNLWYHVGAANETPGLTGFAHLFEHMMFAATRHAPRGLVDKLLEGSDKRPTRTAAPISTAPITTTPCRPTSSSWRCGRTPTAWATCSMCWTRRRCRTSRTWCATSGAKAWRTNRTGSSPKRCTTICSRPPIPTTATSWDRTPTSSRPSCPTSAPSSPATTRPTTPAW